MRFVCGDVRDLIVSHKTDHGPAHWRYRALQQWRRRKNLLGRDFRHRSIFDFCNNICQQRTFVDQSMGPPRIAPRMGSDVVKAGDFRRFPPQVRRTGNPET